MNCVDYAINRVMSSDVDPYLLDLAFTQLNGNFTGNWYNMVGAHTLEANLRDKVIHRTVLPACNVNGGTTEFIDLSGSRITDKGNSVIEVNVPDILTGGRKIVSVNEIYLGTMSSATGALGVGYTSDMTCGQGVISDATQSLVDTLTPNRSMNLTFTNVRMTGNNCFAIFGMNTSGYTLTAKVIMEYDEGLSSISTRHYEYFAELVELATKAYIYRTCRRPTGEAVMRSGVPLEDIREDINEYRDSWNLYKEYLKETWTKCMTYSNRLQVGMDIKASVPRRI